jgi:tetratricopeptide (TPR) repeat protein
MNAQNKSKEERLARVRTHVEAYPDNTGAKLLMVQLLLVDDPQQGIKALEEMISSHPNVLPAYYMLGNAYARQGKLPEARTQFSQLVEKNPNVVGAYMMLGIIDEIEGKHDAAADRYKRALDLNPNLGPAANNLAWHYAEREGKLDVALELARRAKATLPEDPSVADTLGWVLYKRGLYAAAIEHLRFSAEKLPNNGEVRYHLGMAYLRNGDKDKAKAELSAALALGAFNGRDEAERALKEVG